MNGSDGPSDYTTLPEYKAGLQIWKIFPPILIIFGTCGNILAILVLRRKNIRKSVCSTYLIVLAVSDLVVLYTGLLRQWLYMTFETDIRKYGTAICKLHTFIVYLSLDFSSWILIAVTIERVCLVWFPQQTKTRCTKRTAGITLISFFVFLFFANSHILYGVLDKETNTNGTTTLQKCSYISDDYEEFWLEDWPWVDLTLFCGVPFICLLVGNFLIFVKVFKTQRAVRRQIAPTASNRGATVRSNDSRLSSMSIMLFTLNTVFLLCTTPISVYLIGYSAWAKSTDPKDLAVLDMMWAVVNFMMYLNNSLNFLLYILSGSRFRREFMEMFCCTKKQNNQIELRNDSVTKLNNLTVAPSQADHRVEPTIAETVES